MSLSKGSGFESRMGLAFCYPLEHPPTFCDRLHASDVAKEEFCGQ